MGLYNIKGDNSPGKYRNLSFYLNIQKLHLLEMNYDLLVLSFFHVLYRLHFKCYRDTFTTVFKVSRTLWEMKGKSCRSPKHRPFKAGFSLSTTLFLEGQPVKRFARSHMISRGLLFLFHYPSLGPSIYQTRHGYGETLKVGVKVII